MNCDIKQTEGLILHNERSNLFEGVNLFHYSSKKSSYEIVKNIVDDLISTLNEDINYYENYSLNDILDEEDHTTWFNLNTLARPFVELYEDKDTNRKYIRLFGNKVYFDGYIYDELKLFNDGAIDSGDTTDKVFKYNLINCKCSYFAKSCYGIKQLKPDFCNALNSNNEDIIKDFSTGLKALGIINEESDILSNEDKEFYKEHKYFETILGIDKIRYFSDIDKDKFDEDENTMNILFYDEMKIDNIIKNGILMDTPLVELKKRIDSGSVCIEHLNIDNPEDNFINNAYHALDYKEFLKENRLLNDYDTFSNFLCVQQQTLIDFKKSL